MEARTHGQRSLGPVWVRGVPVSCQLSGTQPRTSLGYLLLMAATASNARSSLCEEPKGLPTENE